MSNYGGYYARDPYSADRGYAGSGGFPRSYDPSPPSRSQPQPLVYPQEVQVYRACNPPPAPPPPPAPQPSTREVKVIYYVPGDPNFQLPVLPVPAPVPVPAPLPAAPRPSYVEMPASSQFREGDTFRVVAIQENKYSARPPYRYPGGYVEHPAGPPQRGGGPVGYQPVYYQ